MDYGQFVEWDDRYSVGIEQIDEQHRELVSQMNNLYLGCQKKEKDTKFFFDSHIHLLLRYMRYHFSTEERMLEHIKYPDLAAHSQQHATLIRIIAEGLERIDREESSVLLSGNKLPEFVVRLRDMIISHMAILDKKYVSYIHFVNRKAGIYVKEPVFFKEFFTE
jgi:hemerythrin